MEDKAEDLPSQELTKEVNESLGMEGAAAPAPAGAESPPDIGEDGLPKYAKERIGKLQKRYDRDMRRMQGQLSMLQSQLASTAQPQPQAFAQQPDQSMMGGPQSMQAQPPMGAPAGVQDYVQQAVAAALQAQEQQKRMAQQQQEAAYVQSQYGALQNHLDQVGNEQYDDFDEVVRGDSVPFTGAMRDASLFLPQSGPGAAAHVLYKLGKNPNELKRISELPQIDQARELLRLSRALEMGEGGGGSGSNAQAHRPIGQIKSNPAIQNASAINENTPMEELKRRAKAGWK